MLLIETLEILDQLNRHVQRSGVVTWKAVSAIPVIGFESVFG